MSRDEFLADGKTQRAVIESLIVIREAANKGRLACRRDTLARGDCMCYKLRTQLIIKEEVMSLRIGMRELREKLAEYLESSVPIEVTRHGQTIGFYIPVPKRPNQSERDALLEAGLRMQEEMVRLGITEDELVSDFKTWRKTQDAA